MTDIKTTNKTKFKIRLDSIDSVKRFASKCSMFDFNIDAMSGRYIVNAKSLMGLFALNLSNPITVCLYTDNSNDTKEFENEFCDLIRNK